MFVRIRLPLGQPHAALLVIDRAIASDQGLKYVYVVDAENKAQYRRVATGALQEDGLRVITEGLKPKELIVVGGLQQVRPRMEIKPEQTTMPSLARSAGADTPPAKSPTETKPDKTEAPPTNPATGTKTQEPAKGGAGGGNPEVKKENAPSFTFP